MTTRQLRQYIADKASEAQKRLDTSNMDDATRAFKDAASDITGKNGKVRRSTSNMTKEEMREFAYSLRQFNSLDTRSTFAQSIEWKENKAKYEQFIRNQIKNDKNSVWDKYVTEKGNISKKGYKEYKAYISFLKTMADAREQYGYETLKDIYSDITNNTNPKGRQKEVEKILLDTFEIAKGKHLDQAQLNRLFNDRLEAFDKKKIEDIERKENIKAYGKDVITGINKAGESVKVSPKKDTSNTKVPIKKARKLKEHGKVRR